MGLLDKYISHLTIKKVFIIITFFGLLAYGNILFNGFVWDDEEQIVNNKIIQNLSNFPQIFSGATFSTGGAGLSGWFFRPLLTLSYMINFALWGNNAYGFHLFQLLFHIANACLIFLIIKALLDSQKNKLTATWSLLASLIFVVHPAISEGVSYIAALSEVMFTFFNLLAFYLIIKNQEKKFNLKNALTIPLLLLVAVLYKESAVIIFPILLGFLFIYKVKEQKFWGLVLILTAAFYLFLRLVIVKTPIRHPEFAPISDAPLQTRLLTIPLELLTYILLTFYPANLAISKHFLVKTISINSFLIPLVLILSFIILLVFISYKLKSKLILFGVIWFLLGFSFVSNIFPLDMTIAERWYYFFFVGLIFSLAGILNRVLNSKLNSGLTFLILILVLALALRTMIRNSNWHDGLTLFTHDQKISSNSFDLENNLGVELFRSGQIEQSKPHFEKSIQLSPGWYFSYNNLGAVYEREKNYPAAEKMYRETLNRSDYFLAAENLAKLTLFHKDPKEARQIAQDWLGKLPNNAKLWLVLAMADYRLGNKESALKEAYQSYLLEQSEESAYVVGNIRQGKDLNF